MPYLCKASCEAYLLPNSAHIKYQAFLHLFTLSAFPPSPRLLFSSVCALKMSRWHEPSCDKLVVEVEHD